jgi:hypothetical protein
MTNIIVVDFDDTLALYEGSRAAENIPKAIPNVELIHTLNTLYDDGYEIHIYTARGHLSADNRDHADAKYRDVIEDWLMYNGVKFNKLSFQKPYAVYYVDDKAVRPDELHLLKKLNK